jgi:hypothetical protein
MARKLTLEASIITAIKEHLTDTNLLAPTTELFPLAEALTQVVFEQLQEAGVELSAWNRIDFPETRALAQGAA